MMYTTETGSGDGAFMGKNPILQRAEDILHRLSILEQRLKVLSDRLSLYCLPSKKEALDRCKGKERKGRDVLSPLEELLVSISGRVSEITELVERMTNQVR